MGDGEAGACEHDRTDTASSGVDEGRFSVSQYCTSAHFVYLLLAFRVYVLIASAQLCKPSHPVPMNPPGKDSSDAMQEITFQAQS
jgi:hypothetical protein